MNLPIVKISPAIFLFLITALVSSYASEEFYTIQTGSFSIPETAQQQFVSLSNELNEDKLNYFRIEKVGTFYSVRLGKFVNKSEAEMLLHVLIPQLHDAFILKARILDERIVRIYERENSLSSTVGEEQIEEITEDTVSVDTKKSEDVKQSSLSEPENDDKNNSTDVTQTHADNGAQDSEMENVRTENEGADTSGTDIPGFYEYTLELGDVLLISVWEEPDLKEEVIVRPDGKISFPLAGDVPALGLTFYQLKKKLTKRLKEYIKYPIVSISFRKLGGKKVIVLGEVNKPGVYSVTGKQTVLEAIAKAHGFTLDAVKSSVIHIRGGLQAPQGTRLDLSSAIKETEVGQNIALQSEDIVYVPRRFIANVNYVLTQIISPISQGIWSVRGIQVVTE
jgi:polysaccharide export outer membrane protein